MRSDWLLPLCTGGRAAEGRRRPQGASDAEAGGAAASRPARLDQAGRHRARSVLRHRHDRRGRQAARPALHRHRARPGLCRGRARAHRRDRAGRRRASLAATPEQARRSRASRSAGWSSAACCSPARCWSSASRPLDRAGARRRHADRRPSYRGSIHRSAPTCRARRPATAGRSGTSSGRASACRSTAFRARIRAQMSV